MTPEQEELVRFCDEWLGQWYDRAYLDRSPSAQVLRSDGLNLLKHLTASFMQELAGDAVPR